MRCLCDTWWQGGKTLCCATVRSLHISGCDDHSYAWRVMANCYSHTLSMKKCVEGKAPNMRGSGICTCGGKGWQKNSRQITNDNNPRGHLEGERVAEKVAESFPLPSWTINAKGAGEGSCTHKRRRAQLAQHSSFSQFIATANIGTFRTESIRNVEPGPYPKLLHSNTPSLI